MAFQKTRPRQLYLLGPYFFFFALFWLLPLIGGLKLSVTSNALYGETHNVGLSHYREILNDPRFFKAVKNTVVFTVASIAIILPLSVWIAHLIRFSWKPIRPVLTFGLLLPGLTPPAVLALLFLLVFHGRDGVLNQLFVMPLGFKPINWLKDPTFILPALVLQSVWRWTGMITFFILAGMDAIPRHYYEAARIETTNSWHVFRNITMPALRPVALFCAIYLIADSFSMFSGAYVLLGGSGGTADAGLILVSYIYQNAFTFGRFGTAAAMSMLFAPPLILLISFCMTTRTRWRTSTPA